MWSCGRPLRHGRRGFTAGGDSSEHSASRLVSFFVAFFVGLFISNVARFVVESAVRTVIVCFVESPEAFEEHRPELSEVMKSGWAEAYPSFAGVLAYLLPTASPEGPMA